MPNTLALKRRIKSVGNVKQITKAMELTAAAKMHRSQLRALSARPYASRARQLIEDITAAAPISHPLLSNRANTHQLVILITSNRGLAGGLNASLVRETMRFAKNSTVPTDFYIIGKKGIVLMQRYGQKIVATYADLGDSLDSNDTRPISLSAVKQFLDHTYSSVWVAYNHFHSTLTQKPTVTQLLPFAAAESSSAQPSTQWIFEPGADALLNTVLPRMVDQILLQYVLESVASEHAARMVAMRNATDNAGDLLEDLRLSFNSIRQSSITAQMAEISASITALED